MLMHCALWKAQSDLYSLPLLPHTALWRPLWQSRTQPRGHMFSVIRNGYKTNIYRNEFIKTLSSKWDLYSLNSIINEVFFATFNLWC